MKTIRSKGLGWVPDKPDRRDLRWAPKSYYSLQNLPEKVDLEPQCPEIWDQGALGSCVAHACGALSKFLQMKEHDPEIYTPSRLALYYWNRTWDGNEGWDAGSSIRDGLKTLYTYGDPKEELWRYDVNKFIEKPPQPVYDNAASHKVALYARLPQELNSLRACLAEGFPIVFGFSVYSSFEPDQSGVCPMPSTSDRLEGGHAVMIIGVDMATRMFKIRNSWGKDWGINGHFFMPFDYLLSPDLADDFWVAKTIYP